MTGEFINKSYGIFYSTFYALNKNNQNGDNFHHNDTRGFHRSIPWIDDTTNTYDLNRCDNINDRFHKDSPVNKHHDTRKQHISNSGNFNYKTTRCVTNLAKNLNKYSIYHIQLKWKLYISQQCIDANCVSYHTLPW